MHRDNERANNRRVAGNGRGRRGERGQSLVEVALVLPLLLLLLVIVVDAARAYDAQIVLKNAAREGARFGSLSNPLTPSQIKTLVVQDVLGSGTNLTRMALFDEDDVHVIPDPDADTDSVTVTVTYDFPLWFGGLVGMETFHLRAEAIMPRRGDLEG